MQECSTTFADEAEMQRCSTEVTAKRSSSFVSLQISVSHQRMVSLVSWSVLGARYSRLDLNRRPVFEVVIYCYCSYSLGYNKKYFWSNYDKFYYS